MNNLWAFFLFLASAFASAQPDICNQQDVHSFQRQNFSYHYRLIQSEQKDAPLVIYLPGGPGGTSIGNVDPRVSKDYSLALTDPRGAGCNDSSQIGIQDISSEAIADDIIALVKHLNPKNYILHGHSYGTVVATIFSSKIAKLNLPQPQAIILEGVFGQYWDQRKNEYGLVSSWKKIFRSLSEQMRAKLSSSEESPLTAKRDSWFQAIYQFLYLGKIYFLPYSYDQLLKNFIAKVEGKSYPDDLKKLYTSINFGGLPSSEKTWDAIACNELFYSGKESLDYSYGQLYHASKRRCQADRLNPYDSSAWQMQHKTVYFVGENDPSTPLWQGQYHYDHQEGKQKTFVKVIDAGHRAFQLNLNDCAADLYTALFNNLEITKELKKCAAPTLLLSNNR